jgi:hypothetical protein
MVHSMISSQGVVVPARQSTWLAGRYNNPMPQLTSSPCQVNSATVYFMNSCQRFSTLPRSNSQLALNFYAPERPFMHLTV